MKQIAMRFLMAVLAVFLFYIPASAADTVQCQASDDGYLLISELSKGWYMSQSYAKSIKDAETGPDAMGLVNTYGFIKFDLSGLNGKGPDDIASAVLDLYIYGEGKMGGDTEGPSQANILKINAYDKGIIASNVDFDLNESQVGYAQPDIIAGTTASVNVAGENNWVQVDITNIVKLWMGGTYNNGIRITETKSDDLVGVFWSTKDGGTNEFGLPVAPDNVPVLTVNLSGDRAAAPAFSPASGTTFADVLSVTLSCTTDGAEIRYTVDGSDPSEASLLYQGSIALSGTTTIKARAYKDGCDPSASVTALYSKTSQTIPTVSDPVPDPGPGQISDFPAEISITCSTDGAKIVYTVDGTDPTESSETYTQGTPITLTEPTTIKIRTYMDGMLPGRIVTAAYTKAPSVAQPVFQPGKATGFKESVTVEISCTEPGASIQYTIDGSEPDMTSTLYTGPVTLTETTELKAKAFKTGFCASDTTSAFYTKAGEGRTYRLSVSDDGYLVNSDTVNQWYWTAPYMKAIRDADTGEPPNGMGHHLNSYGFIRFDLENIDGLKSENVKSAKASLYLLGSGSMGDATAPCEDDQLIVHAYDKTVTTSGDPVELVLTEGTGGWSQPDIIGNTETRQDVTGKGVWVTVDITPILKMWLDGGFNNGIRIFERDGGGDDKAGPVWASSNNYLPNPDNPALFLLDKNGNPIQSQLIPYLTVETIPEEGSVSVESVTPADKATGVSVNAAISVFFGKPMNSAGTEKAFSLTDKNGETVKGLFSWSELGRQMTFTPETFLSCMDDGGEYTVTIAATAVSEAGQPLSAESVTSFTTEPWNAPVPKLSGEPSGTEQNPHDSDTVEIELGGTGVYGYRYALDSGEWSGTLAPDAVIEITGLGDGGHTLAVQALNAKGEWVDAGTCEWFTAIPPEVAAVSPADKAKAPVSSSIVVTFTEAMNTGVTPGDAAQISPAVGGAWEWATDKTLKFVPDDKLSADTVYTVTLDVMFTDMASNPLKSIYTWSFEAFSDAELICPVAANEYVLFGGMGDGKGYAGVSSNGLNVLKAGGPSFVDARTLIRFDLAGLADVSPDDIVSARFHYSMITPSGAAMDLAPSAPSGFAMSGFLYVLDTMSYEYTGANGDDAVEHPGSPVFWTEQTRTKLNLTKPGYLRSAPMATITHTTGPDSDGSADITEIVKGWVRGPESGGYANNGMELKDHDDASWQDNENGDGYNWFIASRFNEAKKPYLAVTVKGSDSARIEDKPYPSLQTGSGETHRFTTSFDGDCTWSVKGPEGGAVPAGTLSSASGKETYFTAPDTPGVYRLTLTDAAGSDTAIICVCSPGRYTPSGTPSNSGTYENLYAKSLVLFPLFLDSAVTDAEKNHSLAVYRTCEAVADEIGSGPIGEVTFLESYPDGSGQVSRVIGGTGDMQAAKTAIAAFESLTGLFPVEITDSNGNSVCAINLTGTDGNPGVDYQGGAVYVSATNSALRGNGDLSEVFAFSICDSDGNLIDNSLIRDIELSIRFNTDIIKEGDFESGRYGIGYAEDTLGFLAAKNDDPGMNDETVNIIEADYEKGVVRFRVDHLSAYGVKNGSSDVTAVPENPADTKDDLGSGCFIGATGGFMPYNLF